MSPVDKLYSLANVSGIAMLLFSEELNVPLIQVIPDTFSPKSGGMPSIDNEIMLSPGVFARILEKTVYSRCTALVRKYGCEY